MMISNDANQITSLIMILLTLIGAVFIWKSTPYDREDRLFWKGVGYVVLSMFRFTFNTIHLPVGVLIALYLRSKSTVNKTLKARWILLGFILFLLAFLPINELIESILYPRDQLQTFIISPNQKYNGFLITLYNPEGVAFRSLHEKDDLGFKFLQQLRSLKGGSIGFPDTEKTYQFSISQDHEDERMRQLLFHVTQDGTKVFLAFDNTYYEYKAHPEWINVFTQFIHY